VARTTSSGTRLRLRLRTRRVDPIELGRRVLVRGKALDQGRFPRPRGAPARRQSNANVQAVLQSSDRRATERAPGSCRRPHAWKSPRITRIDPGALRHSRHLDSERFGASAWPIECSQSLVPQTLAGPVIVGSRRDRLSERRSGMRVGLSAGLLRACWFRQSAPMPRGSDSPARRPGCVYGSGHGGSSHRARAAVLSRKALDPGRFPRPGGHRSSVSSNATCSVLQSLGIDGQPNVRQGSCRRPHAWKSPRHASIPGTSGQFKHIDSESSAHQRGQWM